MAHAWDQRTTAVLHLLRLPKLSGSFAENRSTAMTAKIFMTRMRMPEMTATDIHPRMSIAKSFGHGRGVATLLIFWHCLITLSARTAA